MLSSRLCLLPAMLLAAASAFAVPVISVDADPTSSGIQSVVDVQVGTSFSVDIVISGVEPTPPVQGFQFNLGFDPVVLTAVSAVDGGFLTAPVFDIGDLDNLLGDVLFASVTLGTAGVSTAGVLATVGFEASAVGTSLLDLQNVLLSGPSGQDIPVGQVNGGRVNVLPDQTVAEPQTLLILALGLVGLAAFRRRARSQAP